MALTSILIVTRSLPFHGLGGMEAVTWDLARAFTRAGVKVTILTTACARLSATNMVEGVEIHCLPGRSGRYSRRWWKNVCTFYEVGHRDRHDVVLGISMGATSIVTSPPAGSSAFVVQCHGTTWSEMISKWRLGRPVEWLKGVYISNRLVRERRYRFFDGVVAIGPNVLADLRRYPTRALIGNVTLHEIANGIDTSLFRFIPEERARIRALLGIADDVRLTLSVSRLHGQKGIQHGLDGFADALRQNSNQHYLIVGSGPHEEALKAKVSDLGLAGQVTFWGAARREELPALYSAGDIFLFTTVRVEGLPLNVIEALACGLPVILSSHIELSEQPHQYCVDPLNPSQVGAAIADVRWGRRLDGPACLLEERFWLSTSAAAYLQYFEKLTVARRRAKTVDP